MKRKNKQKIKNQTFHAKERALQRYGFDYTEDSKIQFIKKIQTNSSEAIFLRKTSNRATIFAIQYKGIWYAIVYDKLSKEINTFLPREVLKRYEKKIQPELWCS